MLLRFGNEEVPGMLGVVPCSLLMGLAAFFLCGSVTLSSLAASFLLLCLRSISFRSVVGCSHPLLLHPM